MGICYKSKKERLFDMGINNKGLAKGAIVAIIVVVILAVLAVVFVPKLTSKGSESDKIAADEAYIKSIADVMKTTAASNSAVTGQSIRVELKSRTGQVLTVTGVKDASTDASVAAMIAALADKFPSQFTDDKTAVVAPSVDVQVFTSDAYMLTDGDYYGCIVLLLNADGTVTYSSDTNNLSPTFAA